MAPALIDSTRLMQSSDAWPSQPVCVETLYFFSAAAMKRASSTVWVMGFSV